MESRARTAKVCKMTVAELITHLQKMPQDQTVFTFDDLYDYQPAMEVAIIKPDYYREGGVAIQ